MPYLRTFGILALTASLSACQVFTANTQSTEPSTRLQGALTYTNAQWLFQPCSSSDNYVLKPSQALSEELDMLRPEAPEGLFVDFSGHFDASKQSFTPTQRYRLQIEGHGCDDADFTRLLIRASGNEPFWSALQTPKGLILNLPGEPAVALPYIEEQLPGGQFNISSEANSQNLRLWISPQQCIDSMSGTVYHLTAKLQLNEQTLNGCATFGALRN